MVIRIAMQASARKAMPARIYKSHNTNRRQCCYSDP